MPKLVTGPRDSLEKDDIDQLTEHQPSVEFLWHIIPPIPLITQLGLQLLLPPSSPIFTVLALGQPAITLQFPDDPFLFALFPQNPTESSIIGSSPKGKVKEEERAGDPTGKPPEEDSLQGESR